VKERERERRKRRKSEGVKKEQRRVVEELVKQVIDSIGIVQKV
jgi:hypothetical protein